MAITFEHDQHRAIYEKVKGFMREMFGEQAVAFDDSPGFGIQHGSAFITVFVVPWGNDDAYVTARSYVVTGAEPSKELYEFLLKANWNMRFGAFGIDDENDIFFGDSIVGSTLDKEELRTLVYAVAGTADDSDDEIVSRFGGLRAVDRK